MEDIQDFGKVYTQRHFNLTRDSVDFSSCSEKYMMESEKNGTGAVLGMAFERL